MGDDKKKNAVAQAKDEAIPYWDKIAQNQIRRGNYVHGFGAWSMKRRSPAYQAHLSAEIVDFAVTGS